MAHSDAQVQLQGTYDPTLLRQDLAQLHAFNPIAQQSDYHDGRWRGICLYGRDGKADDAAGGAPFGDFQATPALAQAPYYAAILHGLQCRKRSVRVLFLPPGASIEAHRDYGTGFEFGMLRLHLPIVTHADIAFTIDGEQCPWQAGELWYGDFSRVHEVHNRSKDVVRAHLVIDVFPTEQLLARFPSSFLARARARGTIRLDQEEIEVDDQSANIASIKGRFSVPAGRLPSVYSTVTGGTFTHRDNRLFMTLNNGLELELKAISSSVYRLVGLPMGVRLETRVERGALREATILLDGIGADASFSPTAQASASVSQRIELALLR